MKIYKYFDYAMLEYIFGIRTRHLVFKIGINARTVYMINSFINSILSKIKEYRNELNNIGRACKNIPKKLGGYIQKSKEYIVKK